MLRDSYRNQQYFDKFLKYETDRIEKFSNVLKNIDKNDKDKINQCRLYISNFYKNKLTAMYSAGYDKENMKNNFKAYVEYLPTDDISYADAVDILSLAILFDCKLSIDVNRYNDKLINTLQQYLKNNKIVIDNSLPLMFENTYKDYIEILNEKENAEEKMREFLNNHWYKLNKDMPWYDSHNSTNDLYAGYWCWIGAAISKMKALSLEKLSECKYLPIDLI